MSRKYEANSRLRVERGGPLYSEIGEVMGEKRGAEDDTGVMKLGPSPGGGDRGAVMVVTKGAGMVNSM